MSDARGEVLARIRAALGGPPRAAATVEEVGEGPRTDAADVRAGDGDPGDGVDLIGRFVERVADYRAAVAEVSIGEIPHAIEKACARHGARRLLAPEGLDERWVAALAQPLRDARDAPLERDVVAGADGVVTTCALAVAETGSIVLDGGPGQGRRVLTLLPDLHICVVPAARIVAGMAEAFARLEADGAARRPLTFVSGPSATSDIELQRVEGVHGPRRLEVIVALDVP